MRTSGHLSFGTSFCNRFDIPIEYNYWAIAPDYGYFFEHDFIIPFTHRFTLHGYPNIEECFRLFKDNSDFDYDSEFEYEIYALIMSHTYLDLFNAPIFPSYPKHREFKYLKNHKKFYITPWLSDPDNITDVFEEVIWEFDTVDSVINYFLDEYERLPNEKTFFTDKILEAYHND